jgi:hypothetical protein
MLRLVLILGLGAVSTCARALEADCEPAHPFFCMNIHAGCAGRTETATFPFKLKADGARGSIESASDTSDMRQLYENGRAEWGGEDTRVIVWPNRGRGYIRLLTDGRYVFRYYRGDAGIMSYGNCR